MGRKEQIQKGKLARSMKLTDQQIQVCLGGLMGDSSIKKPSPEHGGCRLKMCHCEKQLDYLEWKTSLLRPFIIQEKPTVDKSSSRTRTINGKSFNASPSYIYSTITHQAFTDLYGLFYITENGIKRKTVNMNILNKLQPLAILIWFLDDGCYSYQPKKSTHIMYLSTYRYPLNEHQTMKHWFWHKWKINSIIQYDKIHNKFLLRFNNDDKKKFNELFISPFKENIPTCMHYKFPIF
jgi:hypothetical protein